MGVGRGHTRRSAPLAVAAAAAVMGAAAALWALIRSKPSDNERRRHPTASEEGDDVDDGAYIEAWTIAGLHNPSNLCYLNAILQSLASSSSVPAVLHAAVSLSSRHLPTTATPMDLPLTTALHSLLQALSEPITGRQVACSRAFLRALAPHDSRFNFHHQQDCMEALALLAAALLRDLAPLHRHLRLSSSPLPGLCALVGNQPAAAGGEGEGEGGERRWRVHGVWKGVRGEAWSSGGERQGGGEGQGGIMGRGRCGVGGACRHGGTCKAGSERGVQQADTAGMKGAMVGMGHGRQHCHSSSPSSAAVQQGAADCSSRGEAASGQGGMEEQGLRLTDGQQGEGGECSCVEESDARREHNSTPSACSQQHHSTTHPPSLAAASSHACTQQPPSPVAATAQACDTLLQWPLSGTTVSLLACLACGHQFASSVQPCTDISLPLPPSSLHGMSLTSLLHSYTAPEQVLDVTCPRCCHVAAAGMVRSAMALQAQQENDQKRHEETRLDTADADAGTRANAVMGVHPEGHGQAARDAHGNAHAQGTRAPVASLLRCEAGVAPASSAVDVASAAVGEGRPVELKDGGNGESYEHTSRQQEEMKALLAVLQACTAADSSACRCPARVRALLPARPWPCVRRPALKRLLLARLPQVACIQVQRVAFSPWGALHKAHDHIPFPLLLDLSPFSLLAYTSRPASPLHPLSTSQHSLAPAASPTLPLAHSVSPNPSFPFIFQPSVLSHVLITDASPVPTTFVPSSPLSHNCQASRAPPLHFPFLWATSPPPLRRASHSTATPPARPAAAVMHTTIAEGGMASPTGCAPAASAATSTCGAPVTAAAGAGSEGDVQGSSVQTGKACASQLHVTAASDHPGHAPAPPRGPALSNTIARASSAAVAASSSGGCWYRLIAVVVHHGGPQSGHYSAFRRVCRGEAKNTGGEGDKGGGGGRSERGKVAAVVRGGDSRWFSVSDEHVSEVREAQVLGAEASILLYEAMHVAR
ncbi:unnamed protein product [Closterium sp. NIES-64]|nr:unnamed protein product [Closterium sp. NIES-65]CAI5994461.1 unnamed protein product [Closterium sp. NIES-64]